jgi:hypothetical protein
VDAQIGLTIALEIERPHPDRARDGLLVDPGRDGLALPGDLAREAYIDRDEPRRGRSQVRFRGD